MKKRISALALILILVLALSVPALAADLDYVTDASALLSGDEYRALNRRAETISELYGCGVYLVILDDYNDYGSSMEDAADNIYMDYDLGLGDSYSAILLLMSMNERDYWLRSYGDVGKGALTTRGGKDMAEGFLPYLGEDQWFDAFYAYLDLAEYFLAAYASGDPIYTQSGEFGRALGYAILPAVLIAFVVCTIFKRRMKTANKRETAHEYVTEDGVTINRRVDHYTHTTTTRTKISSDSDSGSGSGSHSSSGGCSTGGKF